MANTINETAIKKLKLLFTVVDRNKGEFYMDIQADRPYTKEKPLPMAMTKLFDHFNFEMDEEKYKQIFSELCDKHGLKLDIVMDLGFRIAL